MYIALSKISAVLAIVLFIVAGVLFLKKFINKKSLKETPQNSIKRIEPINCFKCGNPMEQGFVNVMGNVRWREFDSPPPKTSKYGEKLENLSTDEISQLLTFGLIEYVALRCKACSVLTIDHSKIYKV